MSGGNDLALDPGRSQGALRLEYSGRLDEFKLAMELVAESKYDLAIPLIAWLRGFYSERTGISGEADCRIGLPIWATLLIANEGRYSLFSAAELGLVLSRYKAVSPL